MSTAEKPLTIADQLARWDRFVFQLSHKVAVRLSADRDDVYQELVHTLLRQSDSYDPTRGAFSTWVVLVAQSLAGQLRAKQRRQVRAMQFDEAADIFARRNDAITLADVASDYRTPDPADLAARREAIARVREALENLPRGQRDVVLSRFRDGLPVIQRHGRAREFDAAMETLSEVLAGCS